MICAVIKGPSLVAIYQQIEDVLPYADLIELRLDLFEKVSKNDLKLLRQNFSVPMIFTLRTKKQGGMFEGSDMDYLKITSSYLTLQPEYLDLESHFSEKIFTDIQSKYPGLKIICSYHNFDKTPKDLDGVYRLLKKKSAYLYKIAVMAKNSLDTLSLLLWAKQQDPHLIVVSMGPLGQISRILAPVIGRPFTFASVVTENENKLGQLSAKELVKTYNFRALNSQTKIYGLIGETVDQSVSHESHNALMQAIPMDAIYVKIPVKSSEIPTFLDLASKLFFQGLSVTIPLKEVVIEALKEVDSEALAIGAVNTLDFSLEGIKGFNTDSLGALKAIERCFPVKDKKIVILGAGGAAKAIAYELCKKGARVIILNRNEEKAKSLAATLNCVGFGLNQINKCFLEGYNLMINCTPSSMPIDAGYLLPSATVMDINTKPKESLFLKEARHRGCQLIYGYEMFVEQAVHQFTIWSKGAISSQVSRGVLQERVLEFFEK